MTSVRKAHPGADYPLRQDEAADGGRAALLRFRRWITPPGTQAWVAPVAEAGCSTLPVSITTRPLHRREDVPAPSILRASASPRQGSLIAPHASVIDSPESTGPGLVRPDRSRHFPDEFRRSEDFGFFLSHSKCIHNEYLGIKFVRNRCIVADIAMDSTSGRPGPWR